MGSPLVEHVASLVVGNSFARSAAAVGGAAESAGGLFWIVASVVLVIVACELAGLRYIANNRVGIVEKLWSMKGSVPEGRIIALDGEAGFQAEVLRGGLHFGFWRWQYPHPQGAAGLGAARQDRLCLCTRRRGAAAEPDAGPDCSVQQLSGRPALPGRRGDEPGARAGPRSARPPAGDLARRGLRDQHRAFTVITEDTVYRLEAGGSKELKALVNWQNELSQNEGFNPGDHRRLRSRRPTRSIPNKKMHGRQHRAS